MDLCATQAAIRAGYSPRSAEVTASRLLRNAKVAAAITEAQKARSERTEITQDRVLQELAAMAYYDPADLVSTPMNGPADIAKLPEHVRRAIIGWGWDRHGNFTLKLSRKTPALDLIGRHLGMFVEKHEHAGPGGGAIQLNVIGPGGAPPPLPPGFLETARQVVEGSG